MYSTRKIEGSSTAQGNGHRSVNRPQSAGRQGWEIIDPLGIPVEQMSFNDEQGAAFFCAMYNHGLSFGRTHTVADALGLPAPTGDIYRAEPSKDVDRVMELGDSWEIISPDGSTLPGSGEAIMAQMFSQQLSNAYRLGWTAGAAAEATGCEEDDDGGSDEAEESGG